MTSSSFSPWVPEKPLVVSPQLAVQLGLEEAVMLSLLNDAARFLPHQQIKTQRWFQLTEAEAVQLMPFWQPQDIQRISSHLRAKGVLQVASSPYVHSRILKFSLQASVLPVPNPALAEQAPQPLVAAPGLHLISPQWQPDADTLALLAQHGIADAFSLKQVPEFVLYWRERQEPARAWGSRFVKAVLKAWRDHQAQQQVKQTQQPIHYRWRPSDEVVQALVRGAGMQAKQVEEAIEKFVHYWTLKGGVVDNWNLEFHSYATRQLGKKSTPMVKGWRPSEDALEVLVRAGISADFIEDAIPEFELYWREQGVEFDNWHRKFRDHVQRQWLSFQSALEHDQRPKRIPSDWQPSADVYDVLQLANIDLAFAKQLLPEFVIYWRDTNQVHASWNTRFLQYIKMRWAKRDAQPSASRSTRELTLGEELSDRSWAQ